MDIKYRLESTILKGSEKLAYKVYAGVYVFYVSPKVFMEAVESGLIDTENWQPFYTCRYEDIQYMEVLNQRGETAAKRIRYALENSTVGYLKEELEVVNEMPPIVFMNYLYGTLRFATISMMVKSFTVEMKATSMFKGELFDRQIEKLNNVIAEGYPGVLNLIQNYCDQDYCNSQNLIRKVRESNRQTYKHYNITLGY